MRFQQHDDGVVVDMVEIPAGLRQATAGEEGEEEARKGKGAAAWGEQQGVAPPALALLI